jgi:hypothetical protein
MLIKQMIINFIKSRTFRWLSPIILGLVIISFSFIKFSKGQLAPNILKNTAKITFLENSQQKEVLSNEIQTSKMLHPNPLSILKPMAAITRFPFLKEARLI